MLACRTMRVAHGRHPGFLKIKGSITIDFIVAARIRRTFRDSSCNYYYYSTTDCCGVVRVVVL